MKIYQLKPCIIVLSGTPLTGKTVLAKKLADISNLQIIDVDDIRSEIDETRKLDPSKRWLPQEQELAIMIRSYTILCERAGDYVASGKPVILTGTFSKPDFKKPLEKLYKFTQRKNIPFKAFLLTITDEEALRRIKKRQKEGSASNVDSLEKYQWSKSIFSPINFTALVEINTTNLKHIDQLIINLKS